jgi:hypothetical protein
VLPGEVSSKKSYTDIETDDLLKFKAGTTYRFSIHLKDLFNNTITEGGKTSVVKVLAMYVDHDDYTSPLAVEDI